MKTGKYIAYYRVSTAKQGASGLGLDAQKEAVSRYLNGGDWQLVGEYVETETGKGKDALSKRPQLKAALEACRKEGATLLIAKLDRLARNVHFISGLMEAAKGNGRKAVKFVACDCPEANDLTFHLLASFAEFEANRISQRTKEALAAAKARGVKLGKPENLRSNVEARQQAARAFAERLRGTFEGMKARRLTRRAMVQELNSIGVSAPRGGEWHLTQVQRVHDILKL